MRSTRVNGVLLTIMIVTSLAIPGYASLPDVSRICAGGVKSMACARKVEAHQIATGNEITRSGVKLQVRLKNALVLRLDDVSPYGPWYSYIGALDSGEFHLVHINYNESEAYFLIDSATGVKTHIDAWPVFSESKTRFATVSTGVSDLGGVARVQIRNSSLSNHQAEWSLEWEEISPLKHPYTYECIPVVGLLEVPSPSAVRWITDEELRIQTMQPPICLHGEACPTSCGNVVIKRTNGTWGVERLTSSENAEDAHDQ